MFNWFETLDGRVVGLPLFLLLIGAYLVASQMRISHEIKRAAERASLPPLEESLEERLGHWNPEHAGALYGQFAPSQVEGDDDLAMWLGYQEQQRAARSQR